MGYVEIIKERLTLFDVADMFGITLPRRANVKFRSPLRQDGNPSCTLYRRGTEWRFKDWSHGVDLDLIGFFAAIQGISNGEAIRRLVEKVPGGSHPKPPKPPKPAMVACCTRIWPIDVAGTWQEGVAFLSGKGHWKKRLAQWRGWSDHAVEEILQDGAIGAPKCGGKRGIAFRVDRPAWSELGADGRCFCLEPVGFHWRSPGPKASWRLQPSKATHGFGCPPLPFILGDFPHARLMVITEGQWDAITLAHAAGWLDHDAAWPEEICLLGLRGVDSHRAFLGAYGDFWPSGAKCLLIPDGDAAGRRWFERSERGPSFAQLLAERCAEVHVGTATGGKDLNEAWIKGNIDRQAICQGMVELGLVDSAGRVR